MSSEKSPAREVPAREPAQESSADEAPRTESPSREDSRAPSQGSPKEGASEADSTAPQRSSEPASAGKEQGEVPENPPLPDEAPPGTNPPLPDEAPPESNPPLPSEPAPDASDDGWDYRWDYALSRYVFFNRITGAETLENPRVPSAATSDHQPAPPVITGYNPAIHGDYDPNAWYAKLHEEPAAPAQTDPTAGYYDFSYGATALFNRFTGQFQTEGPGRHSDEAKSRRQLNAYFDVDAAANANNGRSLKAERSGKKPSKNELKFFKEKRRARKEEKRRAWLRD
ncbi:hypothetical protein VUR80DRAFT_3599 [Thermomyces stellatus]